MFYIYIYINMHAHSFWMNARICVNILCLCLAFSFFPSLSVFLSLFVCLSLSLSFHLSLNTHKTNTGFRIYICMDVVSPTTARRGDEPEYPTHGVHDCECSRRTFPDTSKQVVEGLTINASRGLPKEPSLMHH